MLEVATKSEPMQVGCKIHLEDLPLLGRFPDKEKICQVLRKKSLESISVTHSDKVVRFNIWNQANARIVNEDN
jgi:hypothetical protein